MIDMHKIARDTEHSQTARHWAKHEGVILSELC
jgi:hypothetical protein